MQESISIQQIAGDDPALYPLVGPLVMDAKVLKANNNYPFKTSPKFLWYIALNDRQEVRGFIPLELRSNRKLINNYYVEDDNEDILIALLNALAAGSSTDAIVLIQHQEAFTKAGFETKVMLKNYVKMTRTEKKE